MRKSLTALGLVVATMGCVGVTGQPAAAQELSKDESFKRLAWHRATYGTSLRLRRGLLAGGQTYYWRVRAWSWGGNAVGPTFSFTTRGQVIQSDAGVDASVDEVRSVAIPDMAGLAAIAAGLALIVLSRRAG